MCIWRQAFSRDVGFIWTACSLLIYWVFTVNTIAVLKTRNTNPKIYIIFQPCWSKIARYCFSAYFRTQTVEVPKHISCDEMSLQVQPSWPIWQIDVNFSRVCSVIDHEFRHNIVKEAVDPRGDSRAGSRLLLQCYDEIGPLQLGSRDQIFPGKFLYYGL